MSETSSTLKLDDEHPWPGLGSYDEASHAYFQGRDSEAEALVQMIEANRMLSLYGRSGLGKSSLLQAGVSPRLRKRGFLPVIARLDFASRVETPWDQLARLLHEAAVAEGLEHRPKVPDESLWVHLHRDDFGVWTDKNQPQMPVFLIDQFEEAFSRLGGDVGARQKLLETLGELTENRLPSAVAANKSLCLELDLIRPRYRVVVSFREDFLADIRSNERLLPSLTRNVFRLLPMQPQQATLAIERAGHAVLAQGVASSIVNFVAGVPEQDGAVREATVEPVVLSLCCTQLNLRRAPGMPIDATLLRTVGQDIIDSFYIDAMRNMPESVHRFIEDRLVQGRTRGSYARDDAIDQGFIDADQLQALVGGHRLLRLDTQGGVPRIELVHDRLVGVVTRARERRLAEEAAEQERLRAQQEALLETKRVREEAELEKTRAQQALDEARRQEAARRAATSWRYAIAVFILSSVLLSATVYFYVESARQSHAAIEERAATNRASAAAASNAKYAETKRSEADARLSQVSLLAQYGWVGSTDDELLANAVAAQTAIEQILKSSSSDANSRRRGTTVQIFAKERDVARVKLALDSLSALGFKFEVVKAKLPNDATNAVWYGTHADIQDVRLVALALMRAGIPVLTVRPLENYFSNKDLPLIQAGASRVASSWPRLTAQQVMQASSFPLPAGIPGGQSGEPGPA